MELNKQDFEEYLRGMEPEAITGFRFDDCKCPIARWAGVQVGPEGRIFPKEGESFEMPTWVVRFVDHIDNNHDLNPLTTDIFLITARECLETLAEVKE